MRRLIADDRDSGTAFLGSPLRTSGDSHEVRPSTTICEGVAADRQHRRGSMSLNGSVGQIVPSMCRRSSPAKGEPTFWHAQKQPRPELSARTQQSARERYGLAPAKDAQSVTGLRSNHVGTQSSYAAHVVGTRSLTRLARPR